MDRPKCSNCESCFDTTSLRPRMFKCGHTFCSQCIDLFITKGTYMCWDCYEIGIVNSYKEIPVNHYLEKIINENKYTGEAEETCSTQIPLSNISTLPERLQEHKPSSKKNIAMSLGPCMEHTSKQLTHMCIAHKSWVCGDCIASDHTDEDCNIITIWNEIENRKYTQEAFLNDKIEDFTHVMNKIEQNINRLRVEDVHHTGIIRHLETLIEKHHAMKAKLSETESAAVVVQKKGLEMAKEMKDHMVVVNESVSLQEVHKTHRLTQIKAAAADQWHKANNSWTDSQVVEDSTKMRIDFLHKLPSENYKQNHTELPVDEDEEVKEKRDFEEGILKSKVSMKLIVELCREMNIPAYAVPDASGDSMTPRCAEISPKGNAIRVHRLENMSTPQHALTMPFSKIRAMSASHKSFVPKSASRTIVTPSSKRVRWEF